MINYFQAISILFNNLGRISNFLLYRNIDLSNSLNHIAFENIHSNVNIPSFNNSAMDGFALKSKRTRNVNKFNIKTFFIMDTIMAGQNTEIDKLDGDFVVEIMTGAKLPSVFDTIIKLEDILFDKSNKKILINRYVDFGENVRLIGEDFTINDLVLKNGDILLPSHIMALSLFNKMKINVLKRPKIFLLCTGDEITDKHDFINTSDNLLIKNSSAPYIINFFKILNFDISYLGIIKDKPVEFLKKINDIFLNDTMTLIITTGAVSKGKADFIPKVLKNIGAKVLFHKIKIKPGKPILFATFKQKFNFFCLPGNPISSVVGLRFFVYPFLKYLLGQSFERPLKAELISDFMYVKKFDTFFLSYAFFFKSKLCVKILKSQQSFKVSSMLKSNSFVFLKTKDSSKKGDILDLYFNLPKI